MAYICNPSQIAHRHETHVPALQPQAPQQARIPFSYGNSQRKGRFEPPQSQRPQETFGFKRSSPQGLIVGNPCHPNKGRPVCEAMGPLIGFLAKANHSFCFHFNYGTKSRMISSKALKRRREYVWAYRFPNGVLNAQWTAT